MASNEAQRWSRDVNLGSGPVCGSTSSDALALAAHIFGFIRARFGRKVLAVAF